MEQKNNLRTVYIATQRSVMEYAAPSWPPWPSTTNILRLKKVLYVAIHRVPDPINPIGSPDPRSEHPDNRQTLPYAGNYPGGPVEQPGRRGREEEAAHDKRPGPPKTQRLAEYDDTCDEKSVPVSWIRGLCNIPGNDLGDADAKDESLAEQSATAPDADIRKAII